MALPPAAHAQSQTWSPSVNQRMTTPTSHADDYLGVSLSQLIVALGLTLGGPPPPGLDDVRQHQTAAAPHQAPAPGGALVPAVASPALASPDGPLVPAVVERPVKSPEMH